VRRAVEGGVTFFDTTRPRHLEDAIAAVDAPLSEDEVARLEAPYRPHPVLGHQ
jgi:1-deoxyxylulose-5-phosphate synthase